MISSNPALPTRVPFSGIHCQNHWNKNYVYLILQKQTVKPISNSKQELFPINNILYVAVGIGILIKYKTDFLLVLLLVYVVYFIQLFWLLSYIYYHVLLYIILSLFYFGCFSLLFIYLHNTFW